MKATGKHRDRKNGAAREQWEKQKQDRNARKASVWLPRPWPLNGREGYVPPDSK